MDQILLVHGFHKEIVTTIMMVFKDTKAMVCSPNSYTGFFHTATGVSQGDKLTAFQFIISHDYVL